MKVNIGDKLICSIDTLYGEPSYVLVVGKTYYVSNIYEMAEKTIVEVYGDGCWHVVAELRQFIDIQTWRDFQLKKVLKMIYKVFITTLVFWTICSIIQIIINKLNNRSSWFTQFKMILFFINKLKPGYLIKNDQFYFFMVEKDINNIYILANSTSYIKEKIVYTKHILSVEWENLDPIEIEPGICFFTSFLYFFLKRKISKLRSKCEVIKNDNDLNNMLLSDITKYRREENLKKILI